jgi:hypothetical protein
MKKVCVLAILVAGIVPIASAIPINVAASANGGVATQIDDWSSNAPASDAIDGNTDGNWGGDSVSHTNAHQGAWWQVVFTQQYIISQIEIFNRTDCCQDRINPFSVLLYTNESDPDNSPVWSVSNQTIDWQNTSSLTINVPNVLAERLRIQLDGNNYLHMAEVIAMGDVESQSPIPEPATIALTVSALGALLVRRRFSRAA